MPASKSRSVLFIIILAALLLRIPLLLRPAPEFNARPFIEDAYYSLTVARSLGHGNGLTIDGDRRTNGIQPLIVLLYAPAFAMFSDNIALRVCLALVILIELFLVLMVRRKMILLMGRDKSNSERAANIAMFLLLFGFASTVYTLNGLETALASAFSVAVVVRYFHNLAMKQAERIAPYAVLGILGGLTVLARIDAAFLVAALFALHLVWKPAQRIAFKKRAIQAIAFGATAVLVSSPWWIYNYVFFGSITPTSGLSQRTVIPLVANLQALAQYTVNKLFVIGYIPYTAGIPSILILAAITATAASTVIAAVPRTRRAVLQFFAHIGDRWRFTPLTPMLLYTAALAVYYVFNFGAPHFLQRYLFPGHVVWIIIVGILASEFWSRIERHSVPLARFLVSLAAATILAVYAFPYSWNYSPEIAQENDFLQVSEYIHDNIPPSQRVGMGQSGTAGFFNANVVNLDGKVNADVFRANEHGRLCAYLDSARFDYLIDWQHFFDVIDSCSAISTYVPVDTVGRFIVRKHLSD